jgi:hypothetical protein
MTKALSELRVELLPAPDVDAEETDELTGRLLSELLDLDVNAAGRAVSGAAPDAAKGADLLALGALVVQFADSAMLQSLVGVIASWLGRQAQRSIKVTLDGDSLELSGVSTAEQRQLIDLWVKRHAFAP